MTFTEAAVLILRAEGKPLTWRKLAELAVRHELLSHVGTDPAETMRVRLSDIVRRQGNQAPFVEGKGGTYALREWGGSGPGPSPEAAAELEAYRKAHAPAAPVAVETPAPARRRSRGEAAGEEGGSGRKRGRRSRPGAREAGGTAVEAVGVDASAEKPRDGIEPRGTEARGAGRTGDAGQEPSVAAAAGEPTARSGEGRKRRRRGRRGRGGASGGVDAPEVQAVPAPVPAAASVPLPARAPVRVPAPVPAAPVDRPPSRPPLPPPPSGVAGASFDLARASDAALRLLRGMPSRRPLRAAEILAQWASRNVPEGRMPPAALAVALTAADAASRVGAPLLGLSGGRWVPTEWAWGDETAALERKIGEAAAQHLAAVRRTMLRRLCELPLAAFQQTVVALLAAEGFRDIRALEDVAPNGGDPLLLRARMPYGPAEISMIVLVVRGAPGKFVSEEQVAALRGRLPRTGACGGAIVTTGRVSDVARRDLVPPNAIPLLAIEHEALAERLLAHRIGMRVRCLEVPALDPELFGGGVGEGDRG